MFPFSPLLSSHPCQSSSTCLAYPHLVQTVRIKLLILSVHLIYDFPLFFYVYLHNRSYCFFSPHQKPKPSLSVLSLSHIYYLCNFITAFNKFVPYSIFFYFSIPSKILYIKNISSKLILCSIFFVNRPTIQM